MWNNGRVYRNPALPSLARRIGISVGLGFAIALIGSIIEAIFTHHPFISAEFFDDITIGVLAGLVVFFYEQRRYKTILEKIRVIEEMNHHVRNALQAISWAPYTEQDKQIKLIRDAVNRIQWALSEILPGETGKKPNASVRDVAAEARTAPILKQRD